MTDMPDKKALVVEDEENIASLIIDMLNFYDMDVVCASRGDDALKILDEQLVDFAVIDITLPDMSGIALYKNICSQKPGLSSAVIFMSGFVPDRTLQKFIDESGALFIQKPFYLEEFRKILEKLI